MLNSLEFDNSCLAMRKVSVRLRGERDFMSPMFMVVSDLSQGVNCVGPFISERLIFIGNILGQSVIRGSHQFMAGAQNRGKHTQTTAAGQWGEGVQPEPPEPSARDGGADTKKPANDPAGVAASSGQVEDLGLDSGSPKRPGLGWGALAAPSPSSLLRGKALAGGEAPDGERLAPQTAGDPKGPRPAGDAQRRKGSGRHRPRASSPGNTGIPRQWGGRAAVRSMSHPQRS